MSAKPVVYVVEPRQGGRGHRGSQRAATISARYHYKGRQATHITEAPRLAQQHALSQVIIKNGNGRIEREYTYGKDPRRFRVGRTNLLLRVVVERKRHESYIRTVQELLGHRDVSTTMIYTHVLNRGAGCGEPGGPSGAANGCRNGGIDGDA